MDMARDRVEEYGPFFPDSQLTVCGQLIQCTPGSGALEEVLEQEISASDGHLEHGP